MQGTFYFNSELFGTREVSIWCWRSGFLSRNSRVWTLSFVNGPVLLSLCSDGVYPKDITLLEVSYCVRPGFSLIYLCMFLMYSSYPLSDHIPPVGKSVCGLASNSSKRYKTAQIDT